MTNPSITPLAYYFRGVPLIPPLDCVDPQSWLAARIYQMGADQELEACCELINRAHSDPAATGDSKLVDRTVLVKQLRAARRPKPPSLKEQALEAQQRLMTGAWRAEDWQLISRALESINE